MKTYLHLLVGRDGKLQWKFTEPYSSSKASCKREGIWFHEEGSISSREHTDHDGKFWVYIPLEEETPGR